MLRLWSGKYKCTVVVIFGSELLYLRILHDHSALSARIIISAPFTALNHYFHVIESMREKQLTLALPALIATKKSEVTLLHT